jgi:hypothetical protein
VWAPGESAFKKTDFKPSRLQYYLAGSCRYPSAYWKRFGVVTNERTLRRDKTLQDILDFEVDELTGELTRKYFVN